MGSFGLGAVELSRNEREERVGRSDRDVAWTS